MSASISRNLFPQNLHCHLEWSCLHDYRAKAFVQRHEIMKSPSYPSNFSVLNDYCSLSSLLALHRLDKALMFVLMLHPLTSAIGCSSQICVSGQSPGAESSSIPNSTCENLLKLPAASTIPKEKLYQPCDCSLLL